MKICERYKDSHDVQQQLHNTLVELDGDLVHLTYSEGYTYSVRKVIRKDGTARWSRNQAMRNIKEAELNLEPVPLGYVNNRSNAYYIRRKPLRKWKQGLYADYLEVTGQGKIDPYRRAVHKQVGVAHLFADDSFIDMYDDRYPTMVRAWVSIVHFGKDSVAWHRNWAFAKTAGKKVIPRRGGIGIGAEYDYHVGYKGKTVGKVLHGNVMLSPEYRYLTEAFVEAMIHAS